MTWSMHWAPRRYGVIIVDQPTEAEVMTEPGPRVRYTPEVDLTSRRVRVYDGFVAEQSTVLFDSGWQPGDYDAVDVPYGKLVDQSLTYYVQVEAEFVDGRSGLSEMRSFTIGWGVDDDDPPDVTLTKVDMCNGPGMLPRVRLSWDYTPGGGRTHVRTLVMRQQNGEAWQKVATVDPDASQIFFDYEADAYEVYRYAVLPVLQDGADTLIFDIPEIPLEARLEFDGLWIHRCGTPASNMRFDSWSTGDEVVQPLEFQTVWGRRAPVAIVHEQLYHRWSVSGPPAEYNKRDWGKILTALDEQFMESGVFVARFGRQRMSAHVMLTAASRTGAKQDATPSLVLTEVSVEERFG